MGYDVPESEWRIFRALREVALDRFYARVLDEVSRISQDSSRSHEERYHELYGLVSERDEELAGAFDDPRRSRMHLQLAAIHRHGLLEPHEFARFSARTREAIELLSKEFG